MSKKRYAALSSPMLFFLILSIDSITLGIEPIVKNMSVNIVLILIVFALIVIGIQLLFLKVLFAVTHGSMARATAFGILTTLNFVMFYISFMEAFISKPTWGILIISGFMFVFFTGLFFTLINKPKWNQAFCVLLMFMTFGTAASMVSLTEPNVITLSPKVTKYGQIKFKSKPNVHIISFDSMLPQTLAKKHLGIDQLGYSEYLKSKNAYVFKNMFASFVPTKPSLHSVMRLADPSFSKKINPGLISGRKPSPLAYVFRNNGYKIATGYFNAKTFGRQGDYVDEYRSTTPSRFVTESTICRFSGTKEKSMQYYGFCHYMPSLLEEGKREKEWRDVVFDTVREKAHDTQPWMTFHYI